jgi:hypothetical protein
VWPGLLADAQAAVADVDLAQDLMYRQIADGLRRHSCRAAWRALTAQCSRNIMNVRVLLFEQQHPYVDVVRVGNAM